MSVAFSIRSLSKTYEMGEDNVVALDAVDLEVPAGDYVAIMGPSGSGKSTLLNLLGALDSATGGSVTVFGQELKALSKQQRALYRRESIGFVFQQFHLIPTLTASENVSLPLRYGGVSRAERRQRAEALLERVGLGERTEHFPALLSGGERQRVALARALVGGAKLILADEPTGNLDGETAQSIVSQLLNTRGDGTTIVMVTHDPEIAALASRQLRLRDGKADDT